jgi:hypothetical protein
MSSGVGARSERELSAPLKWTSGPIGSLSPIVLSETDLRRSLGRSGPTRQADLLVRAGVLLKDVPVASEAVTLVQRSALARLVFASIATEDDRVAAVVPHPDFALFFQKPQVDEGLFEANSNDVTEVTSSVKLCMGGSDGGRVCVLELFVPRRVVVHDYRTRPSVIPCWPSRHSTASYVRYRARARKLTTEQESVIRALTGTKSLRALAADFGVSHETIRAICRRP